MVRLACPSVLHKSLTIHYITYFFGFHNGATIVDALSTGQCIHLPNVKKSSNLVKSYLGFDPIHKQFKVLLNTATPGVSDEHQVLTLGTPNHSWRKVKCCCISYCYPHSNDGICINGGVYYVAAVNMDPFVNAIVCFDVKSEKLRIVYKAKEDMLLWSDSTLVNYKDEIVLSELYISDPFYVYYYNIKSNTVTRVEIQGMSAFKDFIVHASLDHVEDVKLMQNVMIECSKPLRGGLVVSTRGGAALLVPLMGLRGIMSEKFEVVNRSDDMALWGDSTLSIVSDAYLDFVGMTSRGEIVMSTGYLSNPFYVYYNNIEDNTITRVEVQGMEAFMKANTATSIEIGGMDAFVGCRVHISLSHVKDVKLMCSFSRRETVVVHVTCLVVFMSSLLIIHSLKSHLVWQVQQRASRNSCYCNFHIKIQMSQELWSD
ncbi:hypothetical protein HID58_072647 [Brassica napus]|uniref:F-box associated beta-propeller type 3 domain-containing protein n=1 Tax=Brassica napus TaxID=3708 RepID=A0ABQ7Z504_BRANA|nr:hypothetical protein HID58_072647 [Brassica napus]